MHPWRSSEGSLAPATGEGVRSPVRDQGSARLRNRAHRQGAADRTSAEYVPVRGLASEGLGGGHDSWLGGHRKVRERLLRAHTMGRLQGSRLPGHITPRAGEEAAVTLGLQTEELTQ